MGKASRYFLTARLQEQKNKEIQKTWKNYDKIYVNFYARNSKFLAEDISM